MNVKPETVGVGYESTRGGVPHSQRCWDDFNIAGANISREYAYALAEFLFIEILSLGMYVLLICFVVFYL